jgi:hypothetical protein
VRYLTNIHAEEEIVSQKRDYHSRISLNHDG